jgi:hypothetical protein
MNQQIINSETQWRPATQLRVPASPIAATEGRVVIFLAPSSLVVWLESYATGAWVTEPRKMDQDNGMGINNGGECVVNVFRSSLAATRKAVSFVGLKYRNVKLSFWRVALG